MRGESAAPVSLLTVVVSITSTSEASDVVLEDEEEVMEEEDDVDEEKEDEVEDVDEDVV